MIRYEIKKQVLNTDDLDVIELYLKGEETGLNPVIGMSEPLDDFILSKDGWKFLAQYNSVIEKRGNRHRLTEYVMEEVTYDEDGYPEHWRFMGRADFKGLTVWELQELSAEAPKNKANWRNGMITDADSAHVVKELESLDWFLTKPDAIAALKFHDCYVDQFDEAHEFRVEECTVGDLDDKGTWNWPGNVYVGEYTYIKLYDDNDNLLKLLEDVDDAVLYAVDNNWLIEQGLDEGEHTLYLVDMNNKEIKQIKVNVEL